MELDWSIKLTVEPQRFDSPEKLEKWGFDISLHSTSISSSFRLFSSFLWRI